MNLVRYEPWSLMNRLSRELDRVFADFTQPVVTADTVAWIPSADVREEDNRYVVLVDLPGVEKKDIEVTAEDGVLTIRGERRDEKTVSREGYTRVERMAGRFLRRFTMPEDVQAEGITAKHRNGVLEVSIPKQPEALPRRITVEAA